MIILKKASAGTLESSDAYVTVSPEDGFTVEIESKVMNQYGSAIKACVAGTLKELGVTKGHVFVKDNGAVDCVIAARVETAVKRGGGECA